MLNANIPCKQLTHHFASHLFTTEFVMLGRVLYYSWILHYIFSDPPTVHLLPTSYISFQFPLSFRASSNRNPSRRPPHFMAYSTLNSSTASPTSRVSKKSINHAVTAVTCNGTHYTEPRRVVIMNQPTNHSKSLHAGSHVAPAVTTLL